MMHATNTTVSGPLAGLAEPLSIHGLRAPFPKGPWGWVKRVLQTLLVALVVVPLLPLLALWQVVDPHPAHRTVRDLD